MAYFLMTGDEQPEISKLRKLLAEHEIPNPLNPRQMVRIEAENFLDLDEFEVDYRNDRRVSQRISIISRPVVKSKISTIFKEPYTAPEALYDVDIRYFDKQDAKIQLHLFIDKEPVSEPLTIPGKKEAWNTFTIKDVKIEDGSEIMVNVRSSEGYKCQLDYIQLNLNNVK
jgi:hypothetical protein